jgi:hypothetical protein
MSVARWWAWTAFCLAVAGPCALAGVNVATDGTIIAGGSAHNGPAFNQGAYPASNVIDGRYDEDSGGRITYWLAGEARQPDYFLLDLGRIRRIRTIGLRNTHNREHGDRGTRLFRIWGSDEVRPDLTLVDPEVLVGGVLASTAGQSPVPAFCYTEGNGLAVRKARYLRFEALTKLTPPATATGLGLNEIEVYETDEGASSHPAEVNVALARPVIAGGGAYPNLPFPVPGPASVATSDNGPRYGFFHVTDGTDTDFHGDTDPDGRNSHVASYWLGRQGVAPEFFTVDLGALFAVRGVELLNTHNDRYTDSGTENFRLFASDSVDGGMALVNPKLVLQGTLPDTSGQVPIRPAAFGATNGLATGKFRYLRFEALTYRSGDARAGLNEMRVYGEPVGGASGSTLTVF